MGSGKTTFIMNYMNKAHNDSIGLSFDDDVHEQPKFIYISPLLDELDRIDGDCHDLNFCVPIQRNGRKFYDLEYLIAQGRNICTTHSLFKRLTKSLCSSIKDHGYTLIIDEALECVVKFDDLSSHDRKLLMKDNTLYVEDETNRLRWNHEAQKNYRGKFDNIKHLCDTGNLILIRDTVLLWKFPSEFLNAFEDVFILTYLFEGSLMSSYFKAEGIEYALKTLKNGNMVPYADSAEQTRIKMEARALITVYDGSLNAVGDKTDRGNPFSVNWFKKRSSKELATIKAKTEYFFKSIAQTPSADNAWTTFKKHKSGLSGSGYTRGFIPNNARATNDYKNKKSLSYLCNRFTDTYIRAYFEANNIEVDEDAYALSEMVQWIWRSQIREGKPITVFIPSERMRGLLIDWLHGGAEEDEAEVVMAA